MAKSRCEIGCFLSAGMSAWGLANRLDAGLMCLRMLMLRYMHAYMPLLKNALGPAHYALWMALVYNVYSVRRMPDQFLMKDLTQNIF